MKTIPLTKGKEALVDDDDYEECMEMRWCAKLSNHTVWYAARTETDEHGRYDLYLHNFIMQPRDGERIDHIDRDGLNCQRHNMRVATWSQNSANRILPNSSGFRGVSLTPQGRYRAVIRKDGLLRSIGTYNTAEEAARAYDKKARELHGEFATVNFMR
jgi:hypothetical protein